MEAKEVILLIFFAGIVATAIGIVTLLKIFLTGEWWKNGESD